MVDSRTTYSVTVCKLALCVVLWNVDDEVETVVGNHLHYVVLGILVFIGPHNGRHLNVLRDIRFLDCVLLNLPRCHAPPILARQEGEFYNNEPTLLYTNSPELPVKGFGGVGIFNYCSMHKYHLIRTFFPFMMQTPFTGLSILLPCKS